MYGRKYFLNVFKGSFSEPADPGKESHSFEQITGHLVNINYSKDGEKLRLHVADENNFYMLSMYVKSRPTNAFYWMMKNLDFKYPMTFKIKAIDGKDFFTIEQFGGPVLWYYSTNNRRELPLDKDEERAYFRTMIETEMTAAIQRVLNPYPNHPVYKPMRKGLQGGYFDGYKSKPVRFNNPDLSGDPGFGL